MFQGLKKIAFDNKVDQFKNFITEECKSYNMREFGTLDEMYCIHISKFLDENGKAVNAEVDGNSIRIMFPENVIHDNRITVTYSNEHTMVMSTNDNYEMDIMEMDLGNDDRIFSKYIDLFMEIYNK